MQITRRHHDNGYRGLNNRTNFYADIETIVQRAHQHQNAGARQIQRSVGDIVVSDCKSKADACKDGDPAH